MLSKSINEIKKIMDGFQGKEPKLYSVSGCDLNDAMSLHHVYSIQLISSQMFTWHMRVI